MNSDRKNMCIIAAVTSVGVILTVIFYLWIDKNVANYVYQLSINNHYMTMIITTLSDLADSLAFNFYMLIIIVWFGYIYMRYGVISHRLVYLFLVLAVAQVIIVSLSFAFARYSPELIFISGHYGFHFFEQSSMMGAFPSGHILRMVTVTTAIFLMEFKCKWLLTSFFIVATIAVGLAKIFAQRHFISDEVSGCALGIIIAMSVKMVLYQKGFKS